MKTTYQWYIGIVLSLTLGGYLVDQSIKSVGPLSADQALMSANYDGKKFHNPIAISTVKLKDSWVLIGSTITHKANNW